MNDRQRERMREYYQRQLAALDKPTRKPQPRDVADKRRRVWTHNSFFGHCAMATKNLMVMIDADSTTEEAKEQARMIILELDQLRNLLQKRIDE